MNGTTTEAEDEEQAEEQEQDEEEIVIQRTGTENARAAYATHGYDPARDDMWGR